MLRVTDSDFFKCLGKWFHEIPPQKKWYLTSKLSKLAGNSWKLGGSNTSIPSAELPGGTNSTI
jgi:hypothetical protein